MADEKTPETKGLKARLNEQMNPPESEGARSERLALETLVSLLGSEDETMRLHAAQAILSRPTAPPAKSAATGLIQKLAKAK